MIHRWPTALDWLMIDDRSWWEDLGAWVGRDVLKGLGGAAVVLIKIPAQLVENVFFIFATSFKWVEQTYLFAHQKIAHVRLSHGKQASRRSGSEEQRRKSTELFFYWTHVNLGLDLWVPMQCNVQKTANLAEVGTPYHHYHHAHHYHQIKIMFIVQHEIIG